MTEEWKIQGSQEWLEFRRNKVTASELPAIMGKSKWDTAYTLWQRKLGFTDSIKDNSAMQRGRDLEPIVREEVNETLGHNFIPDVIVHKDLEWAMASLDGIDSENKVILEIKCPGFADHEIAKKNEVPEHYYAQIQWQLFCSDLDLCYYASYFNEDLVIVEVERDDKYILEKLLPAATNFYGCLVDMIAPEKTEDDYTQIVDEGFEKCAIEWKSAHEMLAVYKKKEEYYKNKLVEFSDDSNCIGYGVKLKRVNRDGSVDWKKLWTDLSNSFPTISEDFDPETYRKKQIGYWKVSETK